MSTTIDQRIVEMRFDNAQFERNIATTRSSLSKFEQSLKLEGATKGLENVNSAAKKVDLSCLSTSVEKVGLKFNALYSIADQTLRRITDSAITTGKRMISALTIDPITTGFSEYETKIGAIQTIMSNTASKGTTMEDVTRVIGELNTYADKTIYNFAEMTRNIGTFTAAGVGLEESASAIQGIANLAAASGSTSQQASTAMYQLSQALAAGQVKLMDWNSVVNAGMGGEKFQEALKATAREHGVAVDALIKKNGSFRESLQEGWISADILNETLSKFTVEGAKKYAQSMMDSGKWTQEQADALITEAQAMEDAATKVKTFTQLWDTLKESAQSGWSQTWEILIGDFEEAKETLTKISEVIGGVISASADARNELLQGWKDAGGRTHLVDSLFNLINGIGSIVKPIKEAFHEIFPPLTVEQLLKFTEGLKNLTAKLTLGETTANNLKRTFKGLFAVLDIVKKVFGAVFDIISPLFGKVDDLGGGILGVTAKFGDWLVKLNDFIGTSGIFEKAVDKIHQVLRKIADVVAPVVGHIRDFGSTVKEYLTPSAETIDTLGTAGEKAAKRLSPLAAIGGVLKNIFTGIGNLIKKIAPWVANFASAIGGALGGLMDSISSSVQNADYSKMFDIANGGIMAAIGVFIAKFIKSGQGILDNAGGFLEGIKGILDGVGDALGAFTESLKAEALKKIAISIGILSASLLVLSLIDSEKLTMALTAITTLFAELMASMSIFGKMGKMDGVATLSTVMIALASSLFVLSLALKIMSTMDYDEMKVGLTGMFAGIASFVAAIKLLPDKKVKDSAKAIQKMASALVVFAVALKIMGSMDIKEMGVALLGAVVGLGAFVAAVNLLPENKVTSAAKAIQKMSFALLILSAALKVMGTMSIKEMGVALLGMVVGLAALVGAVNLLPKDTAIRAAGMIGLATAMVVLGAALKIMATMSWSDIARGLTALGGSLLILVGALALMKSAIPGALAMMIVAPALVALAGALTIMGNLSWTEVAKGLAALGGSMLIISVAMLAMKTALPGAAALLVVSGAIMVLAPALMLLGSMSLANIGKSLLMIAGTFTVLGVAALVLQPLVPTILALSGALALLGVACVTIGAGVLALAVGITMLSASGSALALAITTIVSSIISLIPYLIEQVGVGIIALCTVIAEGSGAICEAATAVILALVDALNAAIPPIVECVITLIDHLLVTLAEHSPSIVQAAIDILIALLDGIYQNISRVVQLAIDVVLAFIDGIAQKIPDIVQAAFDLVLAFINGLADGIRENTPLVLEALLSLGTALLDGIMAFFGIHSPSTVFSDIGKNLGDGLIKGIKNIIPAAIKAVKKLGKGVLDAICKVLGIASPSKEFAKIGEYSGMGYAEGLLGTSGLVDSAASDVAGGAIDSFKAAFENEEGVIDLSKMIDPNSPSFDAKGLAKGATGDAVKAYQEALIAKGLLGEGAADGIFGPMTEAATKEYEQALGMVVDGIADEELLNKLLADLKYQSRDPISLSEYEAQQAAEAEALAKAREEARKKFMESVSMAQDDTYIVSKGTSGSTVLKGSSFDASKLMDALWTEELAAMYEKAGEYNREVFMEAASTMIQTALDKELYGAVSQYGSIDKYTEGISSILDSMAQEILNNPTRTHRVEDGMEQFAMYSVEGYIKGMTTGMDDISAANVRAAMEAKEAFAQELKIYSPSRVYWAFGEYMVQGLIKGMNTYKNSVPGVVSNMANTAINGLKSVIAGIADLFGGDVDMTIQPTIRPVLELGDVRTGLSAIDGLLQRTPSLGAMVNLNGINSQRGHIGTNEDVVSAIDKLRGDIANMPRNTYNVNGVTYDDGSNVAEAVKTIVRAARIERRA